MNNPLNLIDFYKADHRRQYPENTCMVYSNFTPRKSRVPGINSTVFFGLQVFILNILIELWNKEFFEKDEDEVVAKYKRRLDNALGKDAVPVDHIRNLHRLQYLPLHIKAVPEGTLVPMKVPALTVRNTVDEHYWLVNYLETIMSNCLWKGCTSATTAFHYYRTFVEYYRKTVGDDNEGIAFIKWQGHDFSARGMSGIYDGGMSALGHLISFWGTDTVWALDMAEDFYGADSDKEILGGSVPATEHSVMCMGTKDGELETVRRLITELYPSGPISIVADTWDYWGLIRNTASTLKDEIINRTGSPIGLDKVVFRPDSGNPYRIIVGYFNDEVINNGDGTYTVTSSRYWDDENGKVIQQWEKDGSLEVLWSIFGGYNTPLEYRVINPKVGLIYGDSITMNLQKMILEGMMEKGFASTCIVLGIGSFTYEYVTRDTYGWAMKATYGEVMEEDEDASKEVEMPVMRRVGREIFKDPKTDSGFKKSAKGLLCVTANDAGELELKDQCTWDEESQGLLETVFLDGKLTKMQTFAEIRKRLSSYI